MTEQAGVGIGRAALRVAGAGVIAGALGSLPLRAISPRLVAPPQPLAAPAPDADDAATLLPADLWIAVECEGLGAIAGGWLDGRLHARLVSSTAWKRFQKTPPYAQLLAGLGVAEFVSGMKPAELAGALLGEQLVAGVLPDGDASGVAAVVRTADAEVSARLVGVARNVGALDREAKDAARSSTIAGVEVVALSGKLWLAAVGRHLVAASSERLVAGLIERAQAPTRTLPPLMATLREREPGRPLLRAAFDARKLASARPDGRLAPEKADNSGGALLLGDLLGLAARADVIGARIDAQGDALTATLDVPGEPRQLPACFRAFAHARASQPLLAPATPDTLLVFALRRDWAGFWADRAELCAPSTEKEFADLQTNLGLFFGGKSLPDDVLPQLDDELLFVLARQTYPGVADPPKLKYPAGAFVYRAKGDAAKLGRDFASGLQNLLSIVNLQRGMEAKPQWMLFVEPFEGVTVYGGRVREDEKNRDVDVLNFSPCAAWVGDRIVLSSTEELLHELVRELRQPADEGAAPPRRSRAPPGATSWMHVDGPALRALAVEDRDWLVTNGVVNEGKPKAQAEREVDALVELLAQLSHASLSSLVRPDGMRLELAVELVPFAAPAR